MIFTTSEPFLGCSISDLLLRMQVNACVIGPVGNVQVMPVGKELKKAAVGAVLICDEHAYIVLDPSIAERFFLSSFTVTFFRYKS